MAQRNRRRMKPSPLHPISAETAQLDNARRRDDRLAWIVDSAPNASRPLMMKKAVAPWVLMDRAPHPDGLSDRFQSEQPADQLGSSAEGLLLWSSQLLVREFCFNVFQQQRKRHSERNEGSVQVGGCHFEYL
jgi:hypothetical protein